MAHPIVAMETSESSSQSLATADATRLQRSQSFMMAESKWAMKTKLRQKSSTESLPQRSISMTSEDLQFLQDSEGQTKASSLKASLHRIVSSTHFDVAMGAVIICNAIMIGAEIQAELYGYNTSLYEHAERIFLLIYSLELGTRYYLYRLKCLQNGWVVFDLLLVSSGVFSACIIEPFNSVGESSSHEDFLSMILIMRTFRLAKLSRTIRLFSLFRPLWMLVSGLLSSVGTMFYILIMLLIILFVFACISVELFTKNARLREDPAFDSSVRQYWADLPTSMLTLIQFVNLDGIGDIYTPMVHREPSMLLFFAAFMMIVSVCLMNLVTAVIVESSFEQAKSDRNFAKQERQRSMQKLLPQVRELFQKLDMDGSGNVTLEEFAMADASVQESLEKICQTDDLVELFEMLDVDGSGSVDIDEFCDQLTNFGSSDQPLINIRLMKQFEFIRREMKENREQSVEKIFNLECELNSIRENTVDTFSKFETKLERLSDDISEMKMIFRISMSEVIASLGQPGGRRFHAPGFRTDENGTDKDEPLSPLSLVAEMANAPNDAPDASCNPAAAAA